MSWLNQGPRQLAGGPDHLYYAAGFGGNFIVVDKQQDLVVVSRWLEPQESWEMVRRVYARVK